MEEAAMRKKKVDNTKEKYEVDTRGRQFLEKWRKAFEWVEYEQIDTIYGQNGTKVRECIEMIITERKKKKKTEENIVPSSHVMYCDPCRKKHYAVNRLDIDYLPSSENFSNQPYIFGCFSLRHQSLNSHSTNRDHLVATDRENNIEKELKGEASGAMIIKEKFDESFKSKLNIIFINVYALMLKGRPYSEYELYVDKDTAKDIGNTYLNRMSTMEFSYAIAAVEVEKFRELFSRTKFFSLMCDESTDVYNLEHVIAYIRFSIRGKVYMKFLGLESVIRANAEQITNILFKMLSKTLCWVPPVDVIKPVEVSDVFMHVEDDENNIIETVDENLIHYGDGLRNTEEQIELVEDVETIDGDGKIESLFGSINECESSDDEMIELVNKETVTTLVLEKLSDRDECVPLLSGFTSDGASVLTGQKSGVNVKLHQKCNYFMLNGHCMSHRVQLSLKDTAKKCKQFKDLFEFLEQLFVFHKTSNVVTNVFRESVRDLDIKCANGTRWVNHVHNALTNIFNSLKAHIAAYESLKSCEVSI